MGVWGTSLYSDDTACDVREDYKDILGEGISEPEATKRMISQWKSELTDPDIAPIFWLALADTQWNLGRLQEEVRRQALMIIDNGSDLIRFQLDNTLAIKRKIVLARLKKKLETAQPAEKKVRKRYVDSTTWSIGEVYRFQLKSGNFALLHVIGFHQDKGGRGPVCEILDWNGEVMPDIKAIEKMGIIYAQPPSQHLCQFLFGSLSQKDFQEKRVSLVAKNIKPKQKIGGYTVFLWRYADEMFKQLFGMD
jgi:hypothetical protein